MAADVGTGTTMAFGGAADSTFLITSLTIGAVERPAIDVTELTDTVGRSFIPGDLYDGGSIEVEGYWDPSFVLDKGAHELMLASITVTGAITVTFPSQSTSGVMSSAGFCTSYSAGVPLEEAQTLSMTIKLTGAITWTDGTN